MKVSDFEFELPDELIARFPAVERSASRLLCLNGADGAIAHKQFTDIVDLIESKDLLVFNNTKVMPARLWGAKASGGKVEILIERLDGEHEAIAHLRANRAPKPGTVLTVGKQTIEVTGRKGQFFLLKLQGQASFEQLMNEHGHMPLPPYIDRDDQATDLERYQTVYAKEPGAVAAPTAGLHFDDKVLGRLTDKGVDMAEVTLHVGAGTFQPVRVDNVLEHEMHSEWLTVNQQVCDQIAACKARGGKVIAVGTTSVRSLETAAQSGNIQPYTGDTNIFIYPGYQFKVIDALVTNFHLPGSTLMMLVSALAGRNHIMHAYQSAIEEKYRFYSYGDAMFITPQSSPTHKKI